VVCSLDTRAQKYSKYGWESGASVSNPISIYCWTRRSFKVLELPQSIHVTRSIPQLTGPSLRAACASGSFVHGVQVLVAHGIFRLCVRNVVGCQSFRSVSCQRFSASVVLVPFPGFSRDALALHSTMLPPSPLFVALPTRIAFALSNAIEAVLIYSDFFRSFDIGGLSQKLSSFPSQKLTAVVSSLRPQRFLRSREP